MGTPRRRGRKPTTGHFETRAGLVYSVCLRYRRTESSLDQIARFAGVSAGTVVRIARQHDGVSLDELHRRRETAEGRVQSIGEARRR